jgi:hypothetical protein
LLKSCPGLIFICVTKAQFAHKFFRHNSAENFTFLWDQPIKIPLNSMAGQDLSTLRSGNGNAAAAEDGSLYQGQAHN